MSRLKEDFKYKTIWTRENSFKDRIEKGVYSCSSIESLPEDGHSPHGHSHHPLAPEDLRQAAAGQLEDHVAGEEEASHVVTRVMMLLDRVRSLMVTEKQSHPLLFISSSLNWKLYPHLKTFYEIKKKLNKTENLLLQVWSLLATEIVTGLTRWYCPTQMVRPGNMKIFWE